MEELEHLASRLTLRLFSISNICSYLGVCNNDHVNASYIRFGRVNYSCSELQHVLVRFCTVYY